MCRCCQPSKRRRCKHSRGRGRRDGKTEQGYFTGRAAPRLTNAKSTYDDPSIFRPHPPTPSLLLAALFVILLPTLLLLLSRPVLFNTLFCRSRSHRMRAMAAPGQQCLK
ncbi:hypothetical protein HPB50_009026 [Hyalomma asiaticum]|uniref:Uncharacterized protein n=1 Tax=Hyalomma asiaticum TaxID=266040 RepID=A0ACB7SWT7_HYAAI|nr:hypothetical protein HPB50_009026 [Hyalomma asiaticum]